MNDAAMIRAFMGGLIDRAGGVDAAAALIGARLGQDVSKGSISKRQSGQLDWPLIEIMALEDAVGDPCVRRWLSKSLPEVEQGACLLRGAAAMAREHGEAIEAIADLAAVFGCRDKARKEVADSLAANERMAALLEGGAA